MHVIFDAFNVLVCVVIALSFFSTVDENPVEKTEVKTESSGMNALTQSGWITRCVRNLNATSDQHSDVRKNS